MKDEIGCFKIITSDGTSKYVAAHKVTLRADNFSTHIIGIDKPYELIGVDSMTTLQIIEEEEEV